MKTTIRGATFLGAPHACYSHMKRRAGQVLRCATAILILAEGLSAQGNLPGTARAAVQLRAVLAPVLKVNVDSFPITFNLPGGESGENSPSFSLLTEWNVESSTRQVQVMAYFSDSEHALADSAGHGIASASIEGRIENGVWRSFRQPTRFAQAGGGMVLFVQSIEATARVGRRVDRFQLRLRPDTELPPGTYHGIVHIRVVAP